MKSLCFALFSAAWLVVFAAFGTTEVSSVEELTAALADTSVSEIVFADNTYKLTASIDVPRPITFRSKSGDATKVIIDGVENYHCFKVASSAAAGTVIENLTLYNGKGATGKGGGGAYLTCAATVRGCIIDACQTTSGGARGDGGGIYANSASALIEDCIIRNCNSYQGSETQGLAVYLGSGATMKNCLVTGNANTSASDKRAVVYVAKGTVRNCTIVNNIVQKYGGLYVADDKNCQVYDTIVWGNRTVTEAGAGRPNVSIGAKAVVSGLCTTIAVGENAITANPSFVDFEGGDYSLSPASPCIGAGTDGCDIGCKPYVATGDALGISCSASRAVGSATVTLKVVGSGKYETISSVTWQGLGEEGNPITHTFGPGTYDVVATVVAGGETKTVTLKNAITVVYVNATMYLDKDCENPTPPYATPGTAATSIHDILDLDYESLTIKVAEGNYPITKCCSMSLPVVIEGTGIATNTVFKRASGQTGFSLFKMQNSASALRNVVLDGNDAAGAAGGAINMTAGLVTNVVVRKSRHTTNSSGGGIYMSGGLVTHCRIENCRTPTLMGNGCGVYLSGGSLENSIVCNCSPCNTTTSSGSGYGGGVYLGGQNAVVKNCTITRCSNCQGGGIYLSSGKVYNTIAYDNAAAKTDTDPDICSASDSTVFNCATGSGIGANGQILSTSPFETGTYQLDGTAAACINKGTNDYAAGETDYYGNDRIFNGTVDIGASEYSRNDVKVSFSASQRVGTGSLSTTLTASLTGATESDYTYSWYFDGSSSVGATGQSVDRTFTSVGHHYAKVVAAKGSDSYEYTSATDYLTVYPTDLYVDAAAGNDGEWPYDMPAKASTNLSAVAELLAADGITLHAAEGTYALTGELRLDNAVRIIGAGMDRTILYRPGRQLNNASARRILNLNAAGAYVEGVCCSNGASATGSGLAVYAGEFACGKVTDCSGTINLACGGVLVSGSQSKLSRSVVTRCRTYQLNYDDCVAGGIYVEGGGIVENCLIVSNSASKCGGVYVHSESCRVRNCTIVGNISCITSRQDETSPQWSGGAAGYSGRFESCVIWDNVDMAENATLLSANAGGPSSLFVNCAIPVSYGTNCVTEDPGFFNAANLDFRFSALSPCARKGLYGEWMVEAVDFFGNPRARNKIKKVDIGYYQSGPIGLSVIVR